MTSKASARSSKTDPRAASPAAKMPKAVDTGAADVAGTADDVDKIRDIIFGGQMREYAARFQSLERKVEDSLERMSRELDKRFVKLEQALESKSANLGDELKSESAERQAGLEQMQATLRTECETLSALISQSRSELDEALQRDTERLDRQKVDSKGLAELFADLAERINKGGQ